MRSKLGASHFGLALAAFDADLARVAGIDEPDWEFKPHKDMRMFSLAHDIDRIHQTLRRWTDCRLDTLNPTAMARRPLEFTLQRAPLGSPVRAAALWQRTQPPSVTALPIASSGAA